MNEPLQEWLVRLCQERGGSAGLLVLGKATGPFEPAAFWPAEGAPAASVLSAVRVALGSGRPVIQTGGSPTEGGRGRDVLAVPFRLGGDPASTTWGAVAVELPQQEPQEHQPQIERLQEALASLPVARTTLPAPSPALLDDARPEPRDPLLELVARTLAAESTPLAARAAVEGVARWLSATRVSIGFCDSAGVLRLAALSDSDRFDQRLDWVRRREAAMMEALDQDTAVSCPARDPAAPVAVAHAALLRGSDSGEVHTVLLGTRGSPGAVIGALTAEFERASAGESDASSSRPDTRRSWDAERSAVPSELKRAASLLGPALHARQQAERSVSRHLVDAARERLEIIFGPGHARAKAVASGVALLALLLAVAPGTFRVSAPAQLQGSVQRAVVAPVDGYIAESRARAGDLVKRGDVLGLMDSTELDLERQKWLSARAQLQKSLRASMAAGDRSEVAIVRARLDQAEAELALVEEQRARTRLVAPFDGVVARGDLSQLLGSPVERGDVLFEVAPLDEFRVNVEVAARDISYISVGQPGRLNLAALSGRPLSFRVARVAPIATTDKDGTYFRVEATLDAAPPALRPGMEGVARVDAGRRSLLWIWTRRVTERLRLVAWSWLP